MNILITGASRGIGFELAKYFSAKRARTVFLLSRNKEKMEELRKECNKIYSSVKIISLPFDLSEEKSFADVGKVVSSETGQLDILINNAGYLVNKPFADVSPEDISKIYSVNVFAPFKLTQALLPFMGKNSRAHIVNIGSMGGVQGTSKFPGLAAYTSSKMALAGLSECMAEELKEKNISVNCLAIGAVQTEMMDEAFPGYKPPHTAAEMASYIGDFAINGHKFFNGKIIPVAVSVP